MQCLFTVKEHALVVVVVILICNFLLSVCVSFPQLLIHNLLNLQSEEREEGNSTHKMLNLCPDCFFFFCFKGGKKIKITYFCTV